MCEQIVQRPTELLAAADVWKIVEKPVNLGGPGIAIGITELFQEVGECLFFRLLHGQGLADVANVVQRLQFGDPALQHHGEQGDDEVRVLPQLQVGLATQLLKPGNMVHTHLSKMKLQIFVKTISRIQELFSMTRYPQSAIIISTHAQFEANWHGHICKATCIRTHTCTLFYIHRMTVLCDILLYTGRFTSILIFKQLSSFFLYLKREQNLCRYKCQNSRSFPDPNRLCPFFSQLFPDLEKPFKYYIKAYPDFQNSAGTLCPKSITSVIRLIGIQLIQDHAQPDAN